MRSWSIVALVALNVFVVKEDFGPQASRAWSMACKEGEEEGTTRLCVMQESIQTTAARTGLSLSLRCLGAGCTQGAPTAVSGASLPLPVHLLIQPDHPRTEKWGGISQVVNLPTGRRYVVSAYIKLINQSPGKLHHLVELMAEINFDKGQKTYIPLGRDPRIRVTSGWVLISGDQYLPANTSIKNVRYYVQIKELEVNYYFDTASLVELAEDPNWKTEAKNRIERNRKSNITIKTIGPAGADSHVEVDVVQKRHGFPFGSAVNANGWVNGNPKYKKFFFENFEWAVLENALKWGRMESVKGKYVYDKANKTIEDLLAKGVKIRGHNVFWNFVYLIPLWVTGLNNTDLLNIYHGKLPIDMGRTTRADLLKAINGRVLDVVGRTKGKVAHWDVNNEDLHGNFFQAQTGDVNITMEMFRKVHKVDPNVQLFLNEYDILNSGVITMAYRHQAERLKQAAVPIYGIGLQSHLRKPIDITRLKHRLDLIGSAGLPVWITELDINVSNETEKAKYLEDLLTLYYSHPAVEGIMLWGFWDGQLFFPDAALANGPDVTPNEAGRRYKELRKQWMTMETRNLSVVQSLNLRGFHGDYGIRVKHNGRVIKNETFTLGKTGVTIEVHLSKRAHKPNVDRIIVG